MNFLKDLGVMILVLMSLPFSALVAAIRSILLSLVICYIVAWKGREFAVATVLNAKNEAAQKQLNKENRHD